MKIFGWAMDHQGCGNYRIGLPMWALGQAGHDARAFSVLDIELPEDLDVFVGQLISGERSSDAWQQLAARPNRDFALIYEIDDDIFRVAATNPSYPHYSVAADRIRDNIRVSDAVTVTNEALAEVIRPMNPNVFVLPNCFDAAVLQFERPKPPRLTVGWAGGSSHKADFLSVAKDLKTFFKRNPTVDTHFIGVNYSAEIGRPGGRHTGWRHNLVDYIRTLDFDIGIAPLEYHVFNRSKSDLKFLEYASLGIPVVASDYGPYAESVQHGVTGMKVKYPHEWARYLHQLTSDDQLRAALGANARDWAATRTIQGNIWRWEDAYRQVLGRTSESSPALAV